MLLSFKFVRANDTFMLQYIVPVLVMAYCYAMMALTIWRNKDLNNAEVTLFSI